MKNKTFRLETRLAWLLLGSCTAGASIADVVAKAGKEELQSGDIKTLVAALPQDSRAAVATNLSALEQLIRSELLRRSVLSEARAKGFDRDPAATAQLERLRDEIIVRLWVAERAKVPPSYPSDAELKQAYETNKAALMSPGEYRLAQIFISAPNGGDPTQLASALRKANEVASKLPGGDFAALARAQSEHAESAAKGGDLDYLKEDRMVPEVLAAVRNLKAGETVGPVKTSQGLHFLKLIDKRAGTALSFADAKERLSAALRSRREAELEQAYLNELGSKLSITVNQIELAKLQPSLR